MEPRKIVLVAAFWGVVACMICGGWSWYSTPPPPRPRHRYTAENVTVPDWMPDTPENRAEFAKELNELEFQLERQGK
jgi:hypothetical protein